MRNKTERLVDINDMVIIRKVQRRLNWKRVKNIAADFDTDLLRQFVISEREDGSLVLLDGQHRRAALLLLAEDGASVPTKVSATVFTGLDEIEEGKLFLGFNSAVVPSWAEKFIVRVTADDPTAIEILNLLDTYGWEIRNYASQGTFQAIATLERVILHSKLHEVDPNLGWEAIRIATEAWGHDQHAVKGPIIEGIAAFIYEYTELGHEIDRGRIVKVLAAFEAPLGTTPAAAFMTQARGTARMNKAQPPMGVAALLRNLYNYQKRSANILPAWERQS